jgi:hypothetical protein
MTQPTPQQWWDAMSGADRTQFMEAVAPDSHVSLDLWMKLRRDGLLPTGRGYGDHDWEYYLPAAHLRYVLSRAAERSA